MWWSLVAAPWRRNRMLIPLQLGLMHALVDAAPAALLYGELARGQSSWEQICRLILLYNCLAFGLQLPLGWLADSLRSYNSVASAGFLATTHRAHSSLTLLLLVELAFVVVLHVVGGLPIE
jgi:hypothetical protein